MQELSLSIANVDALCKIPMLIFRFIWYSTCAFEIVCQFSMMTDSRFVNRGTFKASIDVKIFVLLKVSFGFQRY